MSLVNDLRAQGVDIAALDAKTRKRKLPLWHGPYAATPLGGVTFSMLARFLGCRERFRLHYLEGLRPPHEFNQRIEYGNMWHICEEELAAGVPLQVGFFDRLTDYCQKLAKATPLQAEQIQHWYQVCRVQFPIYAEYWSTHPDVTKRTPVLQEHVFDEKYQLLSGRVVRLRGKWDSVDLVEDAEGRRYIWLQENKTKGSVEQDQLTRQLTFDLQSMLYLCVLYATQSPDIEALGNAVEACTDPSDPVKGVRYNVVRRPLSGGKGTIVRHKATKTKPEETHAEYYQRLARVITEDPNHFFMRWNVEVPLTELIRFRHECLDPVLEQLCRWWDTVSKPGVDPFSTGLHWRHPFGLFNVLDEGGATEYDHYLVSGNEVGLTRVDTLFEELQC